jgi:hypothetical protein
MAHVRMLSPHLFRTHLLRARLLSSEAPDEQSPGGNLLLDTTEPLGLAATRQAEIELSDARGAEFTFSAGRRAEIGFSDGCRAEIDAGPERSVDNLPHSFALRGNSRGDGIIADAAACSQRGARAHRRLAALEGKSCRENR